MPTNPDREALLRKAEQWCDDLGEGSADTADGPEIVHDLVTALREEIAENARLEDVVAGKFAATAGFWGRATARKIRERDQARANLRRVAPLVQAIQQFDISPTFDAKASYTTRKRDELLALLHEHRDAIAILAQLDAEQGGEVDDD